MAEDVVEDPNQRYVRRELIGTGAFKSVFKAYDSEDGIEVAWNQVRLHGVQPQQKAKILGEITILEQLKHPHIMEIYNSWETKDGQYVVFITEIMSMTLKDFVKKARRVRLRSVKKWSLQILDALHYLHSHDPLVIHRDLKCDNLFMNANKGEIKIGDLGLSICMKDKKFAVSVIGTPEFMAPELYEGMYDEKVDIYAFGMCFLEMITGDYPYSECQNAAQVYRKVTQGVKPDGIKLIQNETIKDFIYLCLSHKDVRPSAQELMQHKLFKDDTLDDLLFHLSSESDTQERTTFFDNTDSVNTLPKSLGANVDEVVSTDEQHGSVGDLDTPQRVITSDDDEDSSNPFSDDPNESVTRVVLVENSFENNQVSLKLYLKVGNGYKEVKFPFHLGTDTPAAVAKEMVVALGLSDLHYNMIATGIADTLSESNLVPYGQITTISQAIEGDNGHVILSQTTVDPSTSHPPTELTPKTASEIQASTQYDPIDELLSSDGTQSDTKSDASNNTIILEMLDDPQLQQPLTTTPNTTTTITLVPQPNPDNPNSILERLVDQMKLGVSSSKEENSKSPPDSPQSKSNANGTTKAVSSSSTPDSQSGEDSVTSTSPLSMNQQQAQTMIDEAKKKQANLSVNIPRSSSQPNIAKLSQQPTPTQTQQQIKLPQQQPVILQDEALKFWHQLLKQQQVEEQMLRDKHRAEREELLRRFPQLVVHSPVTPLTPLDANNELKVKVTPSKSFKNLGDSVLSDLEARIARDLSVGLSGKDDTHLVTTTTIVNNLNKTSTMGGTQIYRINTTSMQTTSTLHPPVMHARPPTQPHMNGNMQRPPLLQQVPKKQLNNRSMSQLELQSAPNGLQSANMSVGSPSSQQHSTGDDLTSLISKNLNLLKGSSGAPIDSVAMNPNATTPTTKSMTTTKKSASNTSGTKVIPTTVDQKSSLNGVSLTKDTTIS